MVVANLGWLLDNALASLGIFFCSISQTFLRGYVG